VATRLYGIVWRWHFLFGMAATPIVLVIALTGALYAFEPELSATLDDRVDVAPTETWIDLDRVAALGAAVPRCTPGSIYIPSRRDRTFTVHCEQGEHHQVLVDPYRARAVAEREGHSVFDIVFDLHWELMLGEGGRRIIEWATSCVVALMLSGVILWWPRGKRTTEGVWTIRRGQKTRTLLRDVHAVVGVYALPVLFVMTATGLMWTIHAGGRRWAPLVDDAVTQSFNADPKSTPGPTKLSIAAAVRAAGYDRATDPRAVFLSLPKEPTDTYGVYIYDDEQTTPWVTQAVTVDAYSGKVLRSLSWRDRSALGKVDTLRYSLHVGSILGLPGRIAAVVGVLVLSALCITGPWMWWKRRPAKKLGIPPRAKKVPIPLWIALALLGALLPLLGYTLLAVVGIELTRYVVRLIASRSVGTVP